MDDDFLFFQPYNWPYSKELWLEFTSSALLLSFFLRFSFCFTSHKSTTDLLWIVCTYKLALSNEYVQQKNKSVGIDRFTLHQKSECWSACVRECDRTRACGNPGAKGVRSLLELCVRSACVWGYLWSAITGAIALEILSIIWLKRNY